MCACICARFCANFIFVYRLLCALVETRNEYRFALSLVFCVKFRLSIVVRSLRLFVRKKKKKTKWSFSLLLSYFKKHLPDYDRRRVAVLWVTTVYLRLLLKTLLQQSVRGIRATSARSDIRHTHIYL